MAYVIHSAKIPKEEHGIYQGGAMENRRKFGDRRQNKTMPSVPFKDSKLVTVWECRRKIPDRRIGNTQGERLNDLVISQERKSLTPESE